MKFIKYCLVFIFTLLVSLEGYGQAQLENKVIAAMLNNGNDFIPEFKISKRKGRVKTYNFHKIPAFVLLNVTKSPVNEEEFDTISMFEREVLTEKDRDMLDDFCKKNGKSVPITYGFGKNTPITYIRTAEFKKMFATKNDWHSYYKKYELKPLVTISRPGFNKKKNKAFIYLTYTLGPYDGAGYYMVMKKAWGRWKPKGNMLVWVL